MTKLKNKILNHLIKHDVVDLNIENNHLVITFSFSVITKLIKEKYIEIKDRSSGRRFQSVISNKKIMIPLDELSEINKDGLFDINIKLNLFGLILKRRTAFNLNINLINYVDSKNKSLIKVYKTAKNNLSLKLDSITFNHYIKELSVSQYGFKLGILVEDLENNKPIKGNVILIRRDNKYTVKYPLKLENTIDHSTYTFEGEILLNNLNEVLIKNSRWDASIELINEKNERVYLSLINLQEYKEFNNEEQRYLLEFDHQNDHVTSIYATEGRNSLALWYTDGEQFSKTYNIAKGKSKFNEVTLNTPLNNKMVFFESFLGKSYSGNPKYIYEELIRNPNFKDYTFIWSYSGSNLDNIPGNPIIVNRESVDYFKYLAESKYWVGNIVFPVHKKRRGNIYIQTWHGTPLKKLGFDIEIEGPETLGRENFYVESRNWDYLLSANRYSSNIFKRAFKFNEKMLEVGYPLNDIFYKKNLNELTKQLKSNLNLPSNKKVILYAPTWRDDEMIGSWEHSFKLQFDIEEMYKRFNEDYIIILKMHHLISDKLEINKKYESFVYDYSNYDDIQELYTISDILITDYSSVFFDYANSRKPILFYTYDYERYKNNIRGFYLDMENDLPGPVLKTNDELYSAIERIESINDQFKERYDNFYDKFCYLDDGDAAKRVIGEVFK